MFGAEIGQFTAFHSIARTLAVAIACAPLTGDIFHPRNRMFGAETCRLIASHGEARPIEAAAANAPFSYLDMFHPCHRMLGGLEHPLPEYIFLATMTTPATACSAQKSTFLLPFIPYHGCLE